MVNLQDHLRKTFLTGILGAAPVAVTVFIVWWIDAQTRPIAESILHVNVPFIGILVAVFVIYLVGLIGTSLIGKSVLKIIDGWLKKVPLFRQFYEAWKQIALTPGGTEGVFSKVVLIADETGRMQMLGFTSGRNVEGTDDLLAVFVPQAPNPMNGRLYFVQRGKCQFIPLSTEQAFKVLISTGNYTPSMRGHALEGAS